MITFNVVGTPVQQGSKRHVGGGRFIEAANGHRQWRYAVANKAAELAAELDGPLDGPLMLTVVFRFPMPASRSKKVQAQKVGWKQSAPDLDKLVRTIGDALTESGLIRDDARIGMVVATKVEVTDWSGVVVTLSELSELPWVAS